MPTLHTSPQRRLSSSKGFSLVEVAIGALVLLLIVLPAIAAISNSLRVVDKARDVTLASNMMQTIMEQLRMQTYANASAKYLGSANSATHTFSSNELSTEGFSNQQSKNISVVGVFTKQSSGQMLVELTATWTDLNQMTQSHKLITVISDGGLSDNVNKGW